MTPAELAALVQSDSTLNNAVLQQDYSAQNIPTISEHWDEIFSTYLIDDNLISNYWRYRLSLNRPVNTLDYHPTVINQHPSLIDFVESIINTFYHHDAFIINFSPALIVTPNDTNNEIRFIYSSSNYLCLETSSLVHDAQTLRQFLTTLTTFNLTQYLENSERQLSEKYQGANLYCISLIFHITRQPNLFFGYNIKQVSLPKQNIEFQPQPRPQTRHNHAPPRPRDDHA